MPQYAPQKQTDRTRIKRAFRSHILRESAELIREKQREVQQDYNLFGETGELAKSLKGGFTVRDFDSGAILTMNYLVYARFLDMKYFKTEGARKKRKNEYHIYNRLVFGYIYNQTMHELKFGFTDETQQLIRNKLIEITTTPKGDASPMRLLINWADSGDRNAQAAISKSMRRGYI